MPITDAERKFCDLMEADPSVRWELLQLLKGQDPQLAIDVEPLLVRFETTGGEGGDNVIPT